MGRRVGGGLLSMPWGLCVSMPWGLCMRLTVDTPHQRAGRTLPPHEVPRPPQTRCQREPGCRPHPHLLRALLPPGRLPDRHVRHGHAEVSCRAQRGGRGRAWEQGGGAGSESQSWPWPPLWASVWAMGLDGGPGRGGRGSPCLPVLCVSQKLCRVVPPDPPAQHQLAPLHWGRTGLRVPLSHFVPSVPAACPHG